ncbi:hypothetical protein [Vibrio splendidus]|uniref:hypothetical protein n=1 Tax=Vibrio splendidus TaxID=29497 RepID=UPI000D333979|nr:hypothetical protein [Vibrio splendidus]PTP50615.1 hypothetical protein CWO05_19905 [Vibrio splendidus]
MRYMVIAFILISAKLEAQPISVQVSQQGGAPVTNAVVEIHVRQPQVRESKQRQTLIISQNDRKFSPFISVVEVGRKVEFINQDRISHHIYSLVGPEQFSFMLKPGNNKMQKVFWSTGIAAMGCNIHDWMSGYLKIVGTPYYGLTDEQGTFKLQLPIDYSISNVTVWHPQLTSTLRVNNPKKSDLKFSTLEKLQPIPTQNPPKPIRFMQRYR